MTRPTEDKGPAADVVASFDGQFSPQPKLRIIAGGLVACDATQLFVLLDLGFSAAFCLSMCPPPTKYKHTYLQRPKGGEQLVLFPASLNGRGLEQ